MIYYHKGDSVPEFSIIDSLVKTVEDWHRMAFMHRVKIFLTKSMNEYKNRTGTTARFVTMPMEGRIFISPAAKSDFRQGTIHLGIYLKHELSHSILYQNTSLFRSLRYPGWFMEGLAMYSSGQCGTDGYYTFDQVREKMNTGIFVEPTDWGTIVSSKGPTVTKCPVPDKYHFIYSEFALIVCSLESKIGRNRFTDFIRQSLKSPDFGEEFKNTFGMDLSNYLADFKKTTIQ